MHVMLLPSAHREFVEQETYLCSVSSSRASQTLKLPFQSNTDQYKLPHGRVLDGLSGHFNFKIFMPPDHCRCGCAKYSNMFTLNAELAPPNFNPG